MVWKPRRNPVLGVDRQLQNDDRRRVQSTVPNKEEWRQAGAATCRRRGSASPNPSSMPPETPRSGACPAFDPAGHTARPLETGNPPPTHPFQGPASPTIIVVDRSWARAQRGRSVTIRVPAVAARAPRGRRVYLTRPLRPSRRRTVGPEDGRLAVCWAALPVAFRSLSDRGACLPLASAWTKAARVRARRARASRGKGVNGDRHLLSYHTP